MIGPVSQRDVRARTPLGRLRTDVRGNTLAIMAMAMIPICALAGSAVDTARMYVVKVRLQQACDAGVLAGRKAMQANGTLDAAAVTQAKTFFANNFNSGFMGTPVFALNTGTFPFTPAATPDNQVAGTATTTVPMTVMKMFGAPAVTMTVTCQARFDVADSDIMFVLDTTGSMACTTSDGTAGCNQPSGTYTRPDDGSIAYYVKEKTGSKMSGLRTAVVNFYKKVAQSVDAKKTNIRYGFVTYTSTVNAGYAVTALSPDYMVKKWQYQTRRITNEQKLGNATTSIDTSSTTSATCTAKNGGRTPGATYSATDAYGQPYPVYPFRADGTATKIIAASWNSSNGRCTLTSQTVTPVWTYGQYPYDVSDFVAGKSVTDPSKVTGAQVKWQGCIEERKTTQSSSFDTTLPADLDPDQIPKDDDTRWRPMWPNVIYYRDSTASATYAGNSTSPTNPYGDYPTRANPPYPDVLTSFTNLTRDATTGWASNLAAGYASCGKPVQRLAPLSEAQVSAYVNAVDFVPLGGTYHDTGMIWGTRMISPKGIFQGDTKATSGRSDPNRYIVFMTDGDMAPNPYIYGMYGIENYDRRVTPPSVSLNYDSDGNYTNLIAYHNARFLAECAAAKSEGITVVVVGFGQTLTNQLTTCASPGQAYFASDNASLNAIFQKIAAQVALLRISQ